MNKKIRFFLLFLLGAGLSLGPLFASETRVDSAGGLTTVIDDETSNGDLFLDGNPAGLMLLATHDRFDLAGQWTYQNSQPAVPGAQQQSFSTIPRLTNDSVIKYEGLMVFPDPHWAFQVAGDFLNPQGQVEGNYLADTYSTHQYRSLLRVAYNSGPFALGLELSNTESDDSIDPGLFSAYVGQSSGSDSNNFTRVRAGVISTFPENPDPDSPRWEVAGVFETNVGDDRTFSNLDRFYLGSPTVTIGQVSSMTQYYYFGPEVYYDIPGRLLLKFYSFVTNQYNSFAQSVNPTGDGFSGVSTYTNLQYQAMTNFGTFRLTLPLSEKENLKLGGNFEAILTNFDFLGSGENVLSNQNRQQVNGTLGIGLECPNDYTWGLQFTTQGYVRDNQVISTNSLTATDYTYYQLSLGGEKWLSPQFALRGGLLMEEDLYNQSGYLSVFDSLVSTGVGYQDKGMKLDAKCIVGPESGLNGSSYKGMSLDTEIQGTFFL